MNIEKAITAIAIVVMLLVSLYFICQIVSEFYFILFYSLGQMGF